MGDDPYALYGSLTDFKTRFYLGMAVSDPRSQVKLPPVEIPEPLPDVREDAWVPDGDEAFMLAAIPALGVRKTVLLPMFNSYGERQPQRFFGVPVPTRLWTRHMLGVREAARDRRRRRRGR